MNHTPPFCHLYLQVGIPADFATHSEGIFATHSGMIVATYSGARLPPPFRSEATLVSTQDNFKIRSETIGKEDLLRTSHSDLRHDPVVRKRLAYLGHQNLQGKADKLLLTVS
jgi:hypothetical protein